MQRLVHSATPAILAVLFSFFVCPDVAHAQAVASAPPREIELDNLRTPTSPAFTLLGVAPTDVARPSTPRALATDLVSRTNRGSLIPSNYALEFAPYWLVSHPSLSYEEYTEPSSAQSIAQSFSISFATSRPDTSSDTASTRIALGVRLLPLGGHASSKFRGLEHQLDSIQRTRPSLIRTQADALDEIDEATVQISRLQADLAVTAANNAPRIADIRRRIAIAEQQRSAAKASTAAAEAILKTQADTMRSLAQAMGQADAERVGMFVELASAISGAYPGANFDAGKLSRVGAWATLSYRVESPHLDLIGLFRFLRDTGDDAQNALDVGGRLFWLRNALGLSAEWVARTAYNVTSSAPGNTTAERALTFRSSSRLVGVIDYRAADAVYVTMSFGRDYKTLAEPRHPLVASLGLQFLYGDKPVVKLP